MKTFYTERDIVDMHTAGVVEIEIDDDVVLTDLAREKAIALGLRMKLVKKRSGQPEKPDMPRLAVAPQTQLPPAVVGPSTPAPAPSSAPPSADSTAENSELVSRIKSAIIAKLGTTEYNDLLDQVIPLVLARLRIEN